MLKRRLNMNIYKYVRRGMVCLMVASVLLTAVGCSKKAEEQKTEQTETSADGKYVIDYKTSELYSKEDMDAAIEQIMKEFNTWEGCEMHQINYTDDQKCKDNLSYVNELGTDKKYEECIVFTANFHSPKEGGGAWQADHEYEDYEWYLAREKGGEWELLTWGY